MNSTAIPLLGAALAVAAHAGTAFTYFAGPAGCTQYTGYADPAYCTVPNELPLGTFPVPAAGGSYVDPNFGGTVRLLTGPLYYHLYSLPSPASASGRYIMVRGLAGGFSNILNSSNAQVAYSKVPFSTAGRFWDAANDDVYYYLTGTRVVKHVLSANTDTTLVDYSTHGSGFSSILTGGSSETSKDNWIAFYAPGQHQVCALDINLLKTYCADYTASNSNSRVGWGFIDYVTASKGVDTTTGKRYVFLMANPAMGAWSVNLSTGKLDFEFRGPENPEMRGNGDGICDPGEICLSTPHADLFEDTDGKQYMVTFKGVNSPACELDIVTLAIGKGQKLWMPVGQGGGRNSVMGIAACGDTWPSAHFGCAKQAPYCVISIHRDATRNPWDRITPFPAEPHRDEIMVMRGNGLEIRRLAISRSVEFTSDTYYAQPRAAMSNDGSYVIFDSNFGVPNAERVATIATGMPATHAPAPPPAPAPAPAPLASFAPIRVNAGGRAWTDPLGMAWSADSGATGGSPWVTPGAIAGTASGTLYQTVRYGQFTYRFAVLSGAYTVTLKLAEVSMKRAGQRVFNVAINGTPVLTNFDIIAAVGAPLTALDKSFSVQALNGQITIQFRNGTANSPMVNAIEIAPR